MGPLSWQGSLAARMPLYKVFKPRSATQMPSYSQNQSVFTLSILANLGSAIPVPVGHIESALASTINAQLLNFQPGDRNVDCGFGAGCSCRSRFVPGRQCHVRRTSGARHRDAATARRRHRRYESIFSVRLAHGRCQCYDLGCMAHRQFAIGISPSDFSG